MLNTHLCESQSVEAGARIGAGFPFTKRYNFSTNQYEVGREGIDFFVFHGTFNIQFSDYFIPEARIGFVLVSSIFRGEEIGLSVKAFLMKETVYGIIGGWLQGTEIIFDASSKPFGFLSFGIGFKTSDMESIEVLFMKPFEDFGVDFTRFPPYETKPIKFVGILRISYGLAWKL